MEDIDRTDDVKALIYTAKFKIEGLIRLPFRNSYRGRLSDHLNSSSIPLFIPITDAKVFDLNGKEMLSSDCVIVNRNHIETVIEIPQKSQNP